MTNPPVLINPWIELVRPPFTIAKLVNIAPITMVKMVLITIVTFTSLGGAHNPWGFIHPAAAQLQEVMKDLDVSPSEEPYLIRRHRTFCFG